MGLGTSYVDSTAVLVISGETHTCMEGRGVLQELERKRPADLPSVLASLVKASYRPRTQRELFDDLASAFGVITTGRPGPAFVSLPTDVQAESAEVPETTAVTERSPAALYEKALGDVNTVVGMLVTPS